MTPKSTRQIASLTGVYHAQGGLLGKLRYAMGTLLGSDHCALCDLTHGRIGKRAAFVRCEVALPVALTLLHLDQQPPVLAAHTEGGTPCVVAHVGQTLHTLLDPADLDALCGDVEGFVTALTRAAREAGLVWPDGDSPGSYKARP